MDFLNWNDWIVPTNPYASIFFGIIFTLLMAIFVWFDTKRIRTLMIVIVTGVAVTFIGTTLLRIIGFYGG